jgi:cupin 2 domain-containing protein
MTNIFSIPDGLPGPGEFAEVLTRSGDIIVERIVSHGHTTSPSTWFDQEKNEWVALVQGKALLTFSDGSSQEMKAGDWLFIPAHRRHRVEETSTDPPCIWIAFHFPTSPS